jgi:hypothetical protein
MARFFAALFRFSARQTMTKMNRGESCGEGGQKEVKEKARTD